MLTEVERDALSDAFTSILDVTIEAVGMTDGEALREHDVWTTQIDRVRDNGDRKRLLLEVLDRCSRLLDTSTDAPPAASPAAQ